LASTYILFLTSGVSKVAEEETNAPEEGEKKKKGGNLMSLF